MDGVRSNLGQNMGTPTSVLAAAANQIEASSCEHSPNIKSCRGWHVSYLERKSGRCDRALVSELLKLDHNFLIGLGLGSHFNAHTHQFVLSRLLG
jgi:hypothetical protein